MRSWVDGHDLSTLTPDDDAPLREAWSLLRRLHDAGISHGAATTGSFILADDGVVVVRLARARIRASGVDFRHDVAEFLASSAAVVGAEQAVRCANESLGSERLLDALPVLQPLALSNSTRTALHASSTTIDDVRRATAASGPPRAPSRTAAMGGRSQPGAARARRDRACRPACTDRQLPCRAGCGARRESRVARSRCADRRWRLRHGRDLSDGSRTGASTLGWTTIVQFGATFTNRIAPAGIGAMATNIRYLERAGIRRSAPRPRWGSTLRRAGWCTSRFS